MALAAEEHAVEMVVIISNPSKYSAIASQDVPQSWQQYKLRYFENQGSIVHFFHTTYGGSIYKCYSSRAFLSK